MEITSKIADHIARLSKLSLSSEDREELMKELSSVIEYMEKLKELDTQDIEPTAHILPVTNVLREDVSKSAYERETLLKNAPKKVGGSFHVPQILD